MQPDQKTWPSLFQSWSFPTFNLKQILFVVFEIQINQFPNFPVDKTQKSHDRSKTYPENGEPLKKSYYVIYTKIKQSLNDSHTETDKRGKSVFLHQTLI